MKTELSVRQICFITFAYTAVTKFIVYPTAVSYAAGRDLLISALVDFLVQGVIVWSVSYMCSRTDKTFFGLIEGTLGNVAARIIYGLFALFFILSSVIPVFEQKVYAQSIFYDTVPSLNIFLPVLFFTVYAASKGFENIGRCADICLPIFVTSMLFLFGMSLGEVEWDSFLPVFANSPKAVFGASLANAYRFFEPCWLLMFMGHFKYKKGDAAKITLSYVGGALTVLLLLASFYGIYGEISATRQFAVSRISLFFPAIDVVGRIDLLALYALELVMLFAFILNLQLAVHCIAKCTGYENRALLSLAVNAVFVVAVPLLDNKFDALIKFWSGWMWIATLIFVILIPLASWALKKGERR